MNIVKLLLPGALIMMSLGACASGKSQEPERTVPAALIENVDEEAATIIFQADEVTYHLLQNEPSEAAAEPVIPDYFYRDEGLKLSSDQVAVLLFLLPGNENNFLPYDGPMVMAPFLPFDEFCFRKGDDIVSVLVSTSDMSWAVVKGGEIVKTFPFIDVKAVNRMLKGLQ